MKKPLISIVIPGHNRSHLFSRSLYGYARQTLRDFEIIYLDDDSDDMTDLLCNVNAPGMGVDLKRFWFHKRERNVFRDGGGLLNYGIRAAAGDFILISSPEVIPGRTLCESMIRLRDQHGGDVSLTCFTSKVYLLTQAQQQLIDTVDWKGLGAAAAIRQLPGFYESPSAEVSGLPEYQPRNVDQAEFFVTNMVSGMTRKGWRNMGGFPESDYWGTGDTSWLSERYRRGVPLATLQDMDATCVHQNHDGPHDIPTPRDITNCITHAINGPWDNIRW